VRIEGRSEPSEVIGGIAQNPDSSGRSQLHGYDIGEHRANNVASLLREFGVAAPAITVVVYGTDQPTTLGETQADYVKNRTVRVLQSGRLPCRLFSKSY